MKITISGEFVGYLLIELFTEESPIACQKFIQMFKNNVRHLRKVAIGRLVKSYWFEFGCLSSEMTDVEPFLRSHNERGLLSYCDRHKRVDSFLITLQPLNYLDKKVCVIGRVLHGETVLRAIESVPTYYQKPLEKIYIESGGLLAVGRNLEEIHFEKFKDDFKVVFNLSDKRGEVRTTNEGIKIKCRLPGLGSQESDPDRHLRHLLLAQEFNMADLKEDSKESDVKVGDTYSKDDTIEDIYPSELVLASPLSPTSRLQIVHELLDDNIYNTDRSDSSLYNYVMQNYFMSQYRKEPSKKKDSFLQSLSKTSFEISCEDEKGKGKKKQSVLKVLREAHLESSKPTFSAQLIEVAKKLKTGLLIGSGSFINCKGNYSNLSEDSVLSVLRDMSDQKRVINQEPTVSGLNVTVINF